MVLQYFSVRVSLLYQRYAYIKYNNCAQGKNVSIIPLVFNYRMIIL